MEEARPWQREGDRAWLAMLMLFSGGKPYDSIGHVGLNLVSGLGALTGLTKAFGDVLSYMRLFALGLAGSSLAATLICVLPEQPATLNRKGCPTTGGVKV